MLKFGALTTAIRIQQKTAGTNENGFTEDTWEDILNEDVLCDWQNKYGGEAFRAAATGAKEPARVRLWYLPGIDQTCRVIRIDDPAIPVEQNPIFEITNVDDVGNRHQQLELEVQRYAQG